MTSSHQHLRVMLVDGDDELRVELEWMLRAQGCSTLSLARATSARAALECEEIDVVVTALRLPDMTGFELIAEIRNRYPNTSTVLVTAYADVQSAVVAMRLGVDDFLPKPVTSAELRSAVERAVRRRQREPAVRRLPSVEASSFEEIIGSSEVTQRLIADLRRVAVSECTVLITGESGTGKELVARSLHEHGPRAGKSSRNPEEAVREGSFRRDLLFRLDVLRVHLQPLCERGSDVTELARHFLKKHAPDRTIELEPAAIERLQSYHWPGNMRELENCVWSALALTREDQIRQTDLPNYLRSSKRRASTDPQRGQTAADLPRFEEVQRDHVTRVLRAVAGNKAAAARVLGIHRVTLYRKLASWSLSEL